MHNGNEMSTFSNWPHRVALLLFCATVSLVAAGAFVTTTGAGMAFRDWPTSDGHNMFLYPIWEAARDKFVEHGHRLLGSLVGLISIALVALVWKLDRRRWVRWLTVAALGLVIAQGVLGGMRVHLDRVQLAKLHGCIAPLFLGLTVAIMFATSKRWFSVAPLKSTPSLVRFQRQTLLVTLLAYTQLLVGAQVRHLPAGASASSFRLAVLFHIVLAVVLVAAAAVLLFTVLRQRRDHSIFVRPAVILFSLVVFQSGLGLATWAVKYSMPFGESQFLGGWTNVAGSITQSVTITAHVVIGSLIFSAAVYLSLCVLRFVLSPAPAPSLSTSVLEAVR